MKLDIACGQRPQPGFTGIDLAPLPGAIQWDLFQYPWPIETAIVSEAHCSHFVEHIPHWRPGWDKDGWWMFWEEVARVCEPGARVTVIYPYLKTVRAFQDPTHERFIPTETWSYLSAAWRKEAGLDHYDTDVDFTMSQIRGRGTANQYVPEYWDSLMDIEVELVRSADGSHLPAPESHLAEGLGGPGDIREGRTEWQGDTVDSCRIRHR